MIAGKRDDDTTIAVQTPDQEIVNRCSGVPCQVQTVEDLDLLIERVAIAQKAYSKFSQQQVDRIFRAASMAANEHRISLAKLAARETGMGIVEDKVIKNHFASEFIYHKFKDARTCGLIEQDHTFGIRKIAEPLGILAGIVPTTNPTSTAIFKALIALKTSSPMPRPATLAWPITWAWEVTTTTKRWIGLSRRSIV